MRPSRRVWAVGLGLVAGGFGVCLAFAPIVRARVAAEARRRGVVVDVGTVRPLWLGARLVGVDLRPATVDGVRAHFDEVAVRLAPSLRLKQVSVSGGRITLVGSPLRLADDFRTWRSASAGASEQGHARVPLVADGLFVTWDGGDPSAPVGEMMGLGLARDPDGSRFEFRAAKAQLGPVTAEVAGVSGALDRNGSFIRGRAASLCMEWVQGVEVAPAGSELARSNAPPTLSPVAPLARSRPRAPAERPMADAAPVLPLPDLSAIGMRARSLALLLAEHIPTGADVRVDAVTGKILRGHDTMAVGIGPGPLSILHTLTGFTVDFSTGPTNGTTALSVRATLPTDESDIRLVVSGGPVSLAVLGVQEGAFGLVDVAHATLAGRTRLALAGDANALTFDGDWTARGLAIRDVNLASDVIRGLDVQLLAHGALTPPGNLRLEHLAATIGAIQVTLSGVLDQGPDRVAGSVHFDVPTTPCQTLLESVPTALLPALQGTGVAGTLGARGRFVFDTRSPDDLVLEYQVQDRCRLVNIAAPLARDGFRQPFEHKIYLPDGSTEEQTTGPGTPDWTALDQISPYMQVAVLTTEDGAFFRHHGFNHSAIRASIVANLKARRFVRGASTITMQLAKNLFLSRQKTLSRKLEEVVLTDYLEQAFSKDELMELYLNIIEFGPDVYGITTAAEYYFGRSPAELNLAECIFLASLLPAPLRHGAMRDAGEAPEAWMRVLRALMQSAYDRGLVSASELSEGLAEPVVFWRGGERPVRRPLVRARPRLDGRVDEVGGGISEEPDSP